MLKKIKKILFPPNKTLYYGKYQGTFSYWRLLLWNLRHPGRLYNRWRYGQLFKINSIRKSSFKKKLANIVIKNGVTKNKAVAVPSGNTVKET